MDRYYPVTVAVAPGTTATAPSTTTVLLENAYLADVELLVPPGHGGLTGVRIRMSRQQVIPWGSNSWIIADNYIRVFDVREEIGINTVSVQAYNTDVFEHSFYMLFHIQDRRDNQEGGSSPGTHLLAGVIAEGFTSDTPVPPPPGAPTNGTQPAAPTLPPVPAAPLPPPL
jgi:hypothetical protein